MRTVILSLTAIAFTWVALGCSSTQNRPPVTHTLSGKNGDIIYLICENQMPEGSSTPKRVCWEPSEGESATANRVAVVLFCEKQAGPPGAQERRKCTEIEGVECEINAPTGSNIPQLTCMRTEDKERLELDAQYRWGNSTNGRGYSGI